MARPSRLQPGLKQLNRQLLSAAEKMLSRRLYSAGELRCKLLDKGYSHGDIELALENLLQRGCLNDALLCDMVYRKYHTACRHSHRYIIAKLRARGFDDQTIQTTLKEYADLDESQAALNVLRKRYTRPEALAPAKLVRYLAGKGFSYEIITQAIRLLNEPIM